MLKTMRDGAAAAQPATERTGKPFEPEFLAAFTTLFEERIVFNKLLQLKLGRVSDGHAECHLDMRPDLVGHFTYQRLHGGVISATLDAAAGMAVMAAIAARHMDEPPMKRLLRFVKLGTIDLRVDYLRAGVGKRFDATARVLRLGSRVASTRMEFCGADGELIAAGTAAYIVS
jgi:uncharacterized protein (TIGR00369 family)